MTSLFDPIRIGELELPNRIVMAPLTRNRSPGQVPTPLAVEYYRQRAGAGLIVSEGTQISRLGQGYLDTPGIHTPAQVEGWRKVTDAVHAEGGRIVVQLWHVGRVSHVSLLDGDVPVSPTARPAKTKTFVASGFVETSVPRALATEEIPGIVEEYRHATRCALEAGFDGVEIHAANGYLLEQFLRDGNNDRSDAYGGSIENRVRLLGEVVDAVVGVAGAGRTGLRLSPVTPACGSEQDSDPQALYAAAVQRVARHALAYLHVIEGATGGPRDYAPFDYAALRQHFSGPWMVNNGYQRQSAIDVVASGAADLVAFGKAYISNPDLAERLRAGAELAPWDSSTFYGGGAKGYTDYPPRAAAVGG